MSPRLCLEVWGGNPADLVAIACHAEGAGIDGVYLGESPTALNAETWTTLGAVTVATDRIRVGPVIANLLPDYRSAALLAKQGSALASLGGGRFDFRTGVGAARPAGRAWWGSAGVDYPDYRQRLAEAERQLMHLRTVWDHASHPRIEITIAASSARAWALADRFGDRWETSFATIDEWSERAAQAPPQLRTSLEIDAFVGSEKDPDLVWRHVAATRRGEDLAAIHARALIGSPRTVAAKLRALRDAGIHQIVAAPHDPNDHDAISRLAEAKLLAG